MVLQIKEGSVLQAPGGWAGTALALTLLCAGAKEEGVRFAPALLLPSWSTGTSSGGEVAGDASQLPGWDTKKARRCKGTSGHEALEVPDLNEQLGEDSLFQNNQGHSL